MDEGPLASPPNGLSMVPYDREFTTVVDRRAQIRVGFSMYRGDVTEFFVQLEYWYRGDWLPVARFDHAPDTPMGHDVTSEGLHLDVFRDGEKYRVEDGFPPVELSGVLRYCITYFREHGPRLLRRFERWHDLNDPDR